jgi:hypothetical protein
MGMVPVAPSRSSPWLSGERKVIGFADRFNAAAAHQQGEQVHDGVDGNDGIDELFVTAEPPGEEVFFQLDPGAAGRSKGIAAHRR